MTEILNSKNYDLEKRALQFAKDIRLLVGQLPKCITNIEDGKQLIRSSGSIGANYIEANEALSKKDFLMRIKISRKEARESMFWLELIETGDNSLLKEKQAHLYDEAKQLMMILGAILRNSSGV